MLLAMFCYTQDCQASNILTLPAGEYVILRLVFLQPIRFWRKSIFSSYLAGDWISRLSITDWAC